MKVRFADKGLDRLEVDPAFDAGLSADLVRAFRRRMGHIRGATDERFFYQMKSMHFEKLKGNRGHQHSMRLNDQFRLIVEFEDGDDGKAVVIVSIEDYH